ncbi:MAG: ATP-binding cassette domain-containing protein [Pseudomonadota bacterium]
MRDASLKIGEGEIFCIIGFSGHRNSTLMRHVNRLVEPSAGTIEVLAKT